jgi:uncharacterized protein (DUF58 family)
MVVELFDQQSLQKLEQLALVATQVRVGMMKGDRRSRKRGSSVEFADYRDYVQGDDLRRLDWNIMARLEKPFIKLLEDEEDLSVHILLDASASMDWPQSDSEHHKLTYALRVAAALGYIGLLSGDQVNVTLLKASEERRGGPHRGRHFGIELIRFVEQIDAEGITDLNHMLTSYGQRAGRPGLLILLSDLLSPAGFFDGISSVLSRGFEIGIIHVLSPDEVEPPFGGDVKLVDVETRAEAEISLDGTTLRNYRNRFRQWQNEIVQQCRKWNVHFIPAITDLPWDKLILYNLRMEGLLD